MGFNPRLTPLTAQAQFPGSIATNASEIHPFFVAERAGQIVGGSGTIITTGVQAVTSGTTAGSSVYIHIYKTASATASCLGSFNGSGTTIATQSSRTFSLGTSTTLHQFAAGDMYFAMFTGGAANNVSNAGLKVQMNYMYGYETA